MKHADKEVIGKSGLEIKVAEGSEAEKLEQQVAWLKNLRLNKKKVLFLNTADLIAAQKTKHLQKQQGRNYIEAGVVKACLQYYKECGINLGDIAIIAPVHEHEILLRKHLIGFPEVKICSINDIQGLEKDTVIVSVGNYSTKTSQKKEIVKIYVAFTKAKKKLVVVGAMNHLKEIQPLDQYVKHVEEESQMVKVGEARKFKEFFPAKAKEVLPNVFDNLQKADKEEKTEKAEKEEKREKSEKKKKRKHRD